MRDMSCKEWRGILFFVVTLLLAFLLPAGASAQVSNVGSVQGSIMDSSGAVIQDALVTLENLDTGQQMSAKSDSSGEYAFLNVPVGRYQLIVVKQGFKKHLHATFLVHAAEPLRVNASLALGQITEEVTVTAAPPPIDTVTASEGNTVTGEQINTLPLTNRVFTQLVGLEPGVQAPIQEDPGFGSNSSVAFSVNGVRDDENNLMIDGIRNVDTFGGNAFVAPNLFAISEFRVESNDYSAKAGRSAGGQVNLITRGGSNKFHGNVFEFFRNDKLNAMDALSTLKPENRWNDFGYDVGGPIKKDRLFFFWSEEWRRIIQAGGPNITYTPTVAERGGDFRGRLTGTMTSPCPNPVSGIDPYFDSGTVFDPTTAQNYTCNDGSVVSLASPFDYNGQLNVMDPARIDNNAKLLLATYFPMPTPGYHYSNGGNFNFISQEPNFTKWREESIRMDYKLSDKWSLFGRFSQDSVQLWNPYDIWGDNPFPNVGGSNQNFPIYNATAHLAYTPSPSFISEFTWGLYFANDKSLKNSPLSNRDRAPGLNIQDAFSYQTNLQEGNRIPTIYLNGGYTGIVEIWWFHNYAFSMPFTSDNTWTKGKHIIRFGATYLPEGKSELANPSTNNTNGTFTFTGQYSNNALADFLLGNAENYTQVALDPFGNYRWFNLEPYVEDQIKLRSNLTVSLGLRYEYFQPEHELKNQFASFSPSLYNPADAPTVNWDGTLVPNTGNPLNGIIMGGQNSPYGRALFPSHKAAFAPRIGIAWDPTNTGKMSVRAGYGIFYDRWGSYSQFGINNPPFNQSVNIYNTSLDAPGGVAGTLYASSLNAALAPWNYPSVQKWSLSVQREIVPGTSLSAAYVGTKGTHLLGDYNLNQPAPNPLIADWSISPDYVRPYLGWSNITAYATRFSSNYNSLQVELLHRLRNGLSFQASYTYSKVLTDESSTGSWPQDSFNFRAERGIADFDMTHMLVFNYSWDLPFFHHAAGVKKEILDGWQLSGITKFQSGGPVNVTMFADQAGIGSWNERPNLISDPMRAGPVMANSNPACHALVGVPVLDSQNNTVAMGMAPTSVHTSSAWFNPCAFDIQAPGTFGDSPRNPVRGPGAQVWDMGIMKNFPIHETLGLQFRAQAFNVFNHPGRTSVDGYYDGGGLGVVTGTLNPRIMELSLVLNF